MNMLALISNGLDPVGLLSLATILFIAIGLICYVTMGALGSVPCIILWIVLFIASGDYVTNHNVDNIVSSNIDGIKGTAFAPIEKVKEMPVLEQRKWDLDGRQYASINIPTEYGGMGIPCWVYNPAAANILLLLFSLPAIYWIVLGLGCLL